MTEIVEKSRSPRTVLVALIWSAGLQGCASTGTSIPLTEPASKALLAPESGAVSKNLVTIENILSWPLEGPSGVDRTIAGLRKIFAMEERVGEGLHGGGPVTLSDGYILESTAVYPNDRAIHVYPQQAGCFSPERAAEITGAVMDPVFRSEHGVDFGRTYDARRNGMWVRFTSTPLTYQCVTAIHVRRIKEAQP